MANGGKKKKPAKKKKGKFAYTSPYADTKRESKVRATNTKNIKKGTKKLARATKKGNTKKIAKHSKSVSTSKLLNKSLDYKTRSRGDAAKKKRQAASNLLKRYRKSRAKKN